MKFLRRSWYRFKRLGKGRRKKQKWRNPTGRHNKIRKKRKGYPARVRIGYSKDTKTKGKIMEKTPRMIYNAKELGKIGKNEIAVLGKIGKKKKIEIAKKAGEMKMQIKDMNIEKFIKKFESKRTEAKK